MTKEVKAFARWLAIQGGKARAAQLTTEERSRMGKAGGRARWEGMSKAQRRAHAKKAARARWGKKRSG